MLTRLCGGLLFLLAQIGGAADPPGIAEAADAFVASLREERFDAAANPQVVLSPFCPPDKAKRYSEGLRLLGGRLDQAEAAVVAGSVVVEGDFATCLLVVRKASQPLAIDVQALCLLRTEAGWRIAAGLQHFDNTNFGFEPGRAETAATLSGRATAGAREARARLLSEAAGRLLRRIAEIRQQKIDSLDRESLIKAYLEFDRQRDTAGKIACHLLPPDLPAPMLARLFDALDEPLVERAEHEGEETPSLKPLLMALVAAHKKEDEYCHVAGFLHPEDATDYFMIPFFLAGEPEKPTAWRLLAHGIEVEGLPGPDPRLVEWFEEGEPQLVDELVRQIAATSGPPGAATAEDAHRGFVSAIVQRDAPRTFGLLRLPGDDPEIVDESLSRLDDLWNNLRPPSLPAPMARLVRVETDGEASVAQHLLFQPFAGTGQTLRTVPTFALLDQGHWVSLPSAPTADEASDPRVAKLRELHSRLEREAADGTEGQALRLLGAEWKVASAGLDPAATPLRSPDEGLLEVARALVAKATTPDLAGLVGMTVQPPGNRVDRGTRALAEVADLVRSCRPLATSKANVVSAASIGPFGAATLTTPIRGPEGRSPLRMIVFVRQGEDWRWMPGPQWFRAKNRGYRALNDKILTYWKESLPADAWQVFERFRDWLEAQPDPNP